MQKKILIIGGTSGLGKRLAELYAAEKCLVGIAGRRQHLAESVRQQFPGHIHVLQADVGKDDIAQRLPLFINEMGGIDLCIITASIVEFNESLSAERELNTIAVNVKGFVSVLNVVWHYFVQKGGGHIVGVTSVAAARGNKLAPAYHASKAFESVYLESLRVKAKHEKNNIIITELVPGYMDTAMAKGERMFWVAPVDKAARQAKNAIVKKKQRAFIGKRWWFVYQAYRFMPSFLYYRIVNSRITLQKSKS